MKETSSPLAREAIRRAIDEMKRLRHDAVRAEHILLGLLELTVGSASTALDLEGVDRAEVRRRLKEILPPGTGDVREDGEYPFHPSGVRVLQGSMAELAEGDRLRTAHLLLGILAIDSAPIGGALLAAGVDTASLAARLRSKPERTD